MSVVKDQIAAAVDRVADELESLSRRIQQIQRLVPDAPFADSKIQRAGKDAHARQNRNSPLHWFPPDFFI